MARILIAEDDVNQRQVICATVSTTDLEVFYALNGREAVDMAGTELPDVIVLDVNMPVMDGYEAIALLKADERTRSIPIILLTALAREEDISRGKALGARDYLTKPYHPVELLDRIYALLPQNV